MLDTARVDQDARVAAARAKEAALARQEAELVAGAALPPSRKQADGEVFTLAGDAFGSGQAQLTADAAASVRALGLYLKAIGAGSVQVLGHTDSQGEAEANRALSQRRAERGAGSAGRGRHRPGPDRGARTGAARTRRWPTT